MEFFAVCNLFGVNASSGNIFECWYESESIIRVNWMLPCFLNDPHTDLFDSKLFHG